MRGVHHSPRFLLAQAFSCLVYLMLGKTCDGSNTAVTDEKRLKNCFVLVFPACGDLPSPDTQVPKHTVAWWYLFRIKPRSIRDPGRRISSSDSYKQRIGRTPRVANICPSYCAASSRKHAAANSNIHHTRACPTSRDNLSPGLTSSPARIRCRKNEQPPQVDTDETCLVEEVL